MNATVFTKLRKYVLARIIIILNTTSNVNNAFNPTSMNRNHVYAN